MTDSPLSPADELRLMVRQDEAVAGGMAAALRAAGASEDEIERAQARLAQRMGKAADLLRKLQGDGGQPS